MTVRAALRAVVPSQERPGACIRSRSRVADILLGEWAASEKCTNRLTMENPRGGRRRRSRRVRWRAFSQRMEFRVLSLSDAKSKWSSCSAGFAIPSAVFRAGGGPWHETL